MRYILSATLANYVQIYCKTHIFFVCPLFREFRNLGDFMQITDREYLKSHRYFYYCGVQSCTAIHRVPRRRMGERPLDIEVSCEISGFRPDE